MTTKGGSARKFTTPNMTDVLKSVTFDAKDTPTSGPNSNGRAQPSESASGTQKTSLSLGSLGSLGLIGSKVKVPLANIRVDPNQPRKLMPPEITAKLRDGLGLVAAMREWAALTQVPVLTDYNPSQPNRDAGLATVRERAASILAVGLIEPVSLIPDGAGAMFEIKVGETRTLAHAWLVACGENRFDEIDAILVERSNTDYAQRFIENDQRADLSGIEKAIGVFQVLFEISGRAVPDFNKPETFDLIRIIREEGPAKHGLAEWRAVERRLGMAEQMRYYTVALLGLSSDVLEIARRQRLPERLLRTLREKSKEPTEQLAVLKSLEERAAVNGAGVWTSANVVAELARLRASRRNRRASQDAAGEVRKGLRAMQSALDTAFAGHASPTRALEGQLRHWVKRPDLADIFTLARELAPAITALSSIAVVAVAPTTPKATNKAKADTIKYKATDVAGKVVKRTKKGK